MYLMQKYIVIFKTHIQQQLFL